MYDKQSNKEKELIIPIEGALRNISLFFASLSKIASLSFNLENIFLIDSPHQIH